MISAAGYPIRMQKTVVRKAIRSEVTSTRMKTGSFRNFEKFSRVNWKIMVSFPPLVTAYREIMIIGATTKTAIHAI